MVRRSSTNVEHQELRYERVGEPRRGRARDRASTMAKTTSISSSNSHPSSLTSSSSTSRMAQGGAQARIDTYNSDTCDEFSARVIDTKLLAER